MLRHCGDEYTFHGTDYHLRCYIDPSGERAPVLVVHEPNDNRGRPLAEQRVALAVHLTAQLGLGPEQVNWIEQAQDGSMKSIDFKPYVQEIRPYAADMTGAEMERAERAGKLTPERVTRYRVSARDVPPEDLEARVGEPLPVPASYADRQNHDFERLHDPAKWQYPERAQL